MNLPHPFWVLIYPFRFNLPMSGFPRPLIRLWGVDTSTKNAHLDFKTHAAYFSVTHAHIHITHTYTRQMYTHQLKCSRNTVPDLRHTLRRQSSSVLYGPLSHSGSPQLNQSPRQDRGKGGEHKKRVLKKKTWDFSVLVGVQGGVWGQLSHKDFVLYFRFICQVKTTIR